MNNSQNSNLPPWHARSVEQVLAECEANRVLGLTEEEADARLQTYGFNTLTETSALCWYHILFRQFYNVLIGILLLAAALSLVLGEVTDGCVIVLIIVINAILGFIQEWRADRALQALKSMLAPECTTLRNGREQRLQAALLVPGDIVVLESGDRVPADVRLIETLALRIDESTLTGESVPVGKDTSPVPESAALATRSSMGWMGTSVTHGRALGVVVATGSHSEFGRIGRLTDEIRSEVTPLQAELTVLGRQLGFLAISVAVMVGVIGLFLGKSIHEMFFTGVSLAVAVVPEGLPAVVTITLALGVSAMIKRRALLRKLQAAEALGAASVVCTDKTGTLTKNEMTVQKIWLASGEVTVTGSGYDPEGHFEREGTRLDYASCSDLIALLVSSLHCNHAGIYRQDDEWHGQGDPTEIALVVAAHKAWLPIPERDVIEAEFSFDSVRKRMCVIVSKDGEQVAHIKGAPEVIIDLSTHIQIGDGSQALSDELRQKALVAYQDMAGQGLRTLAIARRTLNPGGELNADSVETELTLCGIVGIIDPPRPEVPQALALAKSAGIKVIMITGDAAPTALAVAKQIGLPSTKSIEGSELMTLDDLSLLQILKNEEVVFARTAPEDKLRIVSLLQKESEVIAMTGDGVNDAPALKKADIGIAMGLRGTDVARNAADMILLDDNFATIIGAIEEGRRQYSNIQKFICYLLSSNVGEIVAILLSIVTGSPLILLPAQILWINLVTDGVAAVALGVEPVEDDVMEQAPRPADTPLLTRSGFGDVIGKGLYIGVVAFLLFHLFLDPDDSESLMKAQTIAFTALVIAEVINVFNYRSLRNPLWNIGYGSNPWLLIAVPFTLALQFLVLYVPFMQQAFHTVPLEGADCSLLIVVFLPLFVVPELIKFIRSRRKVAVGH